MKNLPPKKKTRWMLELTDTNGELTQFNIKLFCYRSKKSKEISV